MASRRSRASRWKTGSVRLNTPVCGKRRHGAFTLFEVLIAMGIFGMSVVGLMMALNGVLSVAKEARLSREARLQMENRIALLEGGEIKELERVVEIESPRMTFVETVRRQSVKREDREVLEGFWEVRIVAKWGTGDDETEEVVSFLRYAP